MSFASTEFLFVFLPIVLLLYFNPWIKTLKFRNLVLIISSMLFYAWGEPIFIVVILFSCIFNWKCVACMLHSGGRRRKAWLVFAISMDVLVLVIFKYLNFITGIIGNLIGKNITTMIALPIGISFYTFQIMSYVFDAYYNRIGSKASLLQVIEYALLFPQLIAGPIVRFGTIANEIIERRILRSEVTEGIKDLFWVWERK